MRVRLKDVAERCGVSTTTVSLVLNGHDDRITPDTAKRVRAAAKELGYTPNTAARSLRTRKTHTLGVITDSILTTVFAYAMLQGAQDEAWDHGYLLLILGTEGDADLEKEALEALAARQVDGLIFGAMYHRTLDFEQGMRGLRSVGLNARATDEGVTAFVPDEVAAAKQATELLLRHGHRHIVHVTENPTDGLARALRIKGFEDALTGSGARGQVRQVKASKSVSREAEALAMELLSAPDRPSAIFAFNDQMAMGIYRAVRRLGLRIPTDLSIVGFDNQEFVAAELDPPLTTMALPHYEMGQLATRQLLVEIGAIDEESGDPGVRLVPCPLVERESVGAADLSTGG